MQKILPLSKYKFNGEKFILDVFSPRRTILLLVFVLTLFCALIIQNKDALVHEPVDVAQVNRITKEDKAQIAIEKFIEANSTLNKKAAKEYSSLITKYAKEHSVDPFLIAGLMKVESQFDRYAVSDAGALGLTQIMPRWHREKIRKLSERFGYFNPFEPEHNIAMGTMIYAEYKQLSKGNRVNALLRYNGSLHHDAPTYANAVLNEFKKAKKWETKV